jgi:hypothetical protein
MPRFFRPGLLEAGVTLLLLHQLPRIGLVLCRDHLRMHKRMLYEEWKACMHRADASAMLPLWGGKCGQLVLTLYSQRPDRISKGSCVGYALVCTFIR